MTIRVEESEMRGRSTGDNSPPRSSDSILFGCLFLLIFPLITFGLWFAIAHIEKWGNVLANFLAHPLPRFVSLLFIIIVAFGLCWFKRLHQQAYGFVEFCFALAIAWNSLTQIPKEQSIGFLALLGSAYLLVRGLINFFEGRDKRRKSATPAA